MQHLTTKGWLPCGVTVGRCPYGDHATTAEVEAMMLEEHGLGSTAVTSESIGYNDGVMSIREQLMTRQDYPNEVMSDLADIAEHHRAVTITPAGSQLYNTMLPGKVHDYDFVILAEPGAKSPSQVILNDVDAQIVPVDIAAEYSLRSTVISEAIAANRIGYRVASGDSQWSSMVSNLRVPDHGFLALLDRTKRSFELVYENEDKAPKMRFSNLKHALRFEMYQRRYGSGDVTDPRLSATEREKWLAMLERRRGELAI